MAIEDWTDPERDCCHVTEVEGEAVAYCNEQEHDEAGILERWRTAHLHYQGENGAEAGAQWAGRITRLALELLRADPEYHKGHLTFEDVLDPLRAEIVTTVDSSLLDIRYAVYKRPAGIGEGDEGLTLINRACEAAWQEFCARDRNELLLRQQPVHVNGKLHHSDLDDALAEIAPAKKLAERGQSTMKVKPIKIDWLWPNYFPLGKLCDLQGDPGQGKSALTAYFAAVVSAGLDWPTGEKCEPAGVIMVSGEDDLADTMVPRLIAAGADRARVFAYTILDEPLFELPRDIELLKHKIRELKAKLVILDPLDCFVSEEIDTNKNQSIRKLLALLARLADQERITIMVVRHLNKDAKTLTPMYRGGGSIGMNAASRQVFMVGSSPDDKDQHIMAHVKGNNGPAPAAQGYRLETATLDKYPDISTVKVVWTGASNLEGWELLQAPDAVAKRESQGPKADAAKEIIREVLAEGERLAVEVEAILKKRLGKISNGTIWNARKAAGVRSRRKGFGGDWIWFLENESMVDSNRNESMD